jgi:protein TonB
MNTNNFLEASFDEIIFHNRNKNYGAYVLRQEQERNTKIALLSSCTFFCMLLLIPFLKNIFSNNNNQPPFKELVFEVYDLPSILPKRDEIKLTPPPSAANTQRSVEMVVRRQENMIDENIPTQEQLSQSNIGTVTTDNPAGNYAGAELGVPSGTGIEPPAVVQPPLNSIVDFPEILPEFPGGEKALYQFISKHVFYPERAKQLEQEGKVFLKFVVNEDGKVSNVEVLRKVGFGFDEESTRVVSMLPAFRPAMQNGRNVKARYIIPISFKLN